MKLEELKNSIIKKNAPDSLLVFVTGGNNFLAEQYLEGIAKSKELDINKINSLKDLESASALVFDYSSMVNVLRVEVFDEFAEYKDLKNVVVICNKLDKKIEKVVADYVITMPKLTDWQVVDYILTLCPGLDEDEAKMLYKITYGDIYRIDNEASKIAMFPKSQQKDIFMQIYYQQGSDLFAIGDYDLINAITANNKAFVKDLLLHRENVILEPLSINNQALNKFKKILFVNQDSGLKSFESVGIGAAEASGIRRYYNNISLDRLASAIKFLSATDLKLKSGELDMTKDQLADYILCNIMR